MKHPRRHTSPDSQPLGRLPMGTVGIVTELNLSDQVLWKFMEMGFAVGRRVRLVRRAPLGDPLEIELLGYRLAVRSRDVEGILVRPIPKEAAP